METGVRPMNVAMLCSWAIATEGFFTLLGMKARMVGILSAVPLSYSPSLQSL